MSIQDDYYDLQEDLKDQPEALASLNRIWDRFCNYEAELDGLREYKAAIDKAVEILRREL